MALRATASEIHSPAQRKRKRENDLRDPLGAVVAKANGFD
jgi:hypothetical protein